MLEMSCRFTVLSTDGPTVLVKPDITFSHGYHRFNGYTHGGFQHDTVASFSVVRNLWILMHLMTDAMTCEFPDYTIALSLAMALYGVTDISQMSSMHCLLYTLIKRFLGGSE